MSLRRLLSTSRKVPPTIVPPPVEAAGSDPDPHDDKRDPITPRDDPELYIYYKSYNLARDKCLDGTFYKRGTTEADVQEFVSEIAPTIHGAVEITETEKMKIANNGARSALEQFGVLPPK